MQTFLDLFRDFALGGVRPCQSSRLAVLWIYGHAHQKASAAPHMPCAGLPSYA